MKSLILSLLLAIPVFAQAPPLVIPLTGNQRVLSVFTFQNTLLAVIADQLPTGVREIDVVNLSDMSIVFVFLEGARPTDSPESPVAEVTE